MAVNRKRVVFFERWFDPIAEDVLNAEEDIELVRLRYATAEAENWSALALACGYQVQSRTELREPYFGSADLLSRCPRMLALCSAGAGYDVIDVDACTAAGVIVCNQSGTNSQPVAEHAMALMLGLTKRVGHTHRLMMRGEADDRLLMTGNNILGKTIGIVGIGQIGRLTAKFCSIFDMRVLAYDPYLTAEQINARGAEKVDFATLLAQSDFVCVHCPRSRETVDMFGAAEFAQMKKSAYFVNTARGRIHNEAALLEALTSGTIAGAGIDVFDEEPPPPDHPLLHLDNVLATPHIAGGTAETLRSMSQAAAEQWIGMLRGRVPPRLVNPEAWPLYSERFEQIIGFRPDALEPAQAAVA